MNRNRFCLSLAVLCCAALSGPVLSETGMFDMAYLESLVSEPQSGEREHSSLLWSLLMFESFLRQVHAGGAEFGTGRSQVAAGRDP